MNGLFAGSERPHALPVDGDGTSEARFLESLRAEATDLDGADDVEALRHLETACCDDLSMTEGDLRFLLEGIVDYGRVRKRLAKVERRWRRCISALASQRSRRPRVAMPICDGQAIRTFMLTDVSRKLAEWAEIFVLSPHRIEGEVAALGPHAHFLPIPMMRRSRFDHLVSFAGFRQTTSPTNERMVRRLEENLRQAIECGKETEGALRLWQIGAAYPAPKDYRKLYCWNLKFFARLYALQHVAALMELLQLDLVFNTSINSWPSKLWTRAAALNGTPLVGNVLSWDNMSTKTLLDEFVDMYLIWGEEMDEDFAMNLPFVRRKPRVIVGSPQFEPILQGRGLVSRAEFLGRYGLDPNKKLILHATGSKSNFPAEPECLDCMLSHWRQNLRDRAGIMIRMHPKDRQHRYTELMRKYAEVPFTLAGGKLEYGDQWVPTAEDISLLVNQLHHTDLIINVASTMTLEGFVLDKPTINIGFDMGVIKSYRYPLRDMYLSRHYADIVTSGAARLVDSFEELYAAIDDVLDHRRFDTEKQRRILWKKCNHISDSSRRINSFLYVHAMKLLIRRTLRGAWQWPARLLSRLPAT